METAGGSETDFAAAGTMPGWDNNSPGQGWNGTPTAGFGKKCDWFSAALA
jgi:hypothetical protein